jgi:hypothetical protein
VTSKDFADEGGLCLGVAFAVVFETAGEVALEVGVPLCEVGIRPQAVAKVKLVSVALSIDRR